MIELPQKPAPVSVEFDGYSEAIKLRASNRAVSVCIYPSEPSTVQVSLDGETYQDWPHGAVSFVTVDSLDAPAYSLRAYGKGRLVVYSA